MARPATSCSSKAPRGETPAAEIPAEVGDAFAAKAGFDPRGLSTPYTYFHIEPRRLQAWREVNELAGRDLMREGRWLVI